MPERPLSEARRALQAHFGFPDFHPRQRTIVRAALQRRDVLAVLPTGSGKSVCFQIPALLDPGLTIVVSPLISLMDDQVVRAVRYGLPAASLTSAIDAATRRRTEAEIRAGRARLLYVSPERLRSRRLRKLLRDVDVSRLAVDEAHCVSEWGHDFRPSYRQIAEFRDAVGRPPLIALTATATAATRADIIASLELADPIQVVASVDRPNLRWAAARARSLADGVSAVGARVASTRGQSLVYLQTRRNAERMAESLRRRGLAATAYHAGMTPEQRDHAQRAFLAGEVRVVCATNAFGMGIDHPHVRAVCHLGVPGSLEALVQESGRAGRDGRPADCELISHPGDLALQRSLARGSQRPFRDRRVRRRALARLRAIRTYLESQGCRRRVIAAYFGEPAPVCNGCDRCGGGVARGRVRPRSASF